MTALARTDHGRERPAGERSAWRAVAIPSEHGGWGLTLEPVLLGLLVAWSPAGAMIGLAAVGAFVARTPAKLVAVDLRRDRWLARSSLAARIAAVEAIVIAGLAVVATVLAGWRWWLPVAAAAPFVAVEAWYEVRSRGRRLVPEVCGAVGVAATVAAIVLADDGDGTLAVALWIVLGARSVGAIPFVRAQIARQRRGTTQVRASDVAQALAVALGIAAWAIDDRVVLGVAGLTVIAVAQMWWSRHDPPPMKVVGVRQMVLGLALVALTATGVLLG